MNRRHIWLIFKKEFVDILRDRKSWIGALLIPIIVVPVVIFLLGSAMEGVQKDARSFIPIALQGDGQSEFVQKLLAVPGVTLVQTDQPKEALQKAEIRAIITVPKEFQETIKNGGTAEIEVLYDSSNSKSSYARELIEEQQAAYTKEIVQKRLQAAQLPSSTIEPVKAKFQSVASDEKMSGSILAGIVTLMLVVTLASGGIAAATDLVAGEKERGTLESLITAPVAPKSILTAKLLAVMLMCVVSAIASLFSITVLFSVTSMSAQQGFSLGFFNAASIIVFLLMILLLAAMFSSVLIIISTIAKSFKESQTYMAPIVVVGMVPAYMLMPLNPTDVSLIYYILPVFNGVAIFKEIFYGQLEMWHALLTLVTTVGYVSLAIWLASVFFQREGSLLK